MAGGAQNNRGLTGQKENRIRSRRRVYIQINGRWNAQLVRWVFMVDLVVEQESRSGRRGSTHTLACLGPWEALGCRAPVAVATPKNQTRPPLTLIFRMTQNFTRNTKARHATALQHGPHSYSNAPADLYNLIQQSTFTSMHLSSLNTKAVVHAQSKSGRRAARCSDDSAINVHQ